ncbi:hypothetical protein [Streptomyces sp. NPDC101249]|uniref:hypothetical protein n=1 Tax=Streptomyces sp. NPDC101249 TaxID=3366140 RepID=UPI00380BF54C
MAESMTPVEFRCELLADEGNDLRKGDAAFFSVDLLHGTARMYSASEYAETAPVLVGAGWHYRVPVPPLDNGQANGLLRDLTPHAENLFKMTAIREDPLGVIFYGGAGTAMDEIQRKCAASWRAHYAPKKQGSA